jgi:hypothetical protein
MIWIPEIFLGLINAICFYKRNNELGYYALLIFYDVLRQGLKRNFNIISNLKK